MDYQLAIEDAPETVPGGTALLLLHPSTGGTDHVDTGFLEIDADRFLVVSTRSTAREVRQKLEHYGVDESRADILDTISVDRGYSRRSGANLHYVNAPDDVDGIVETVEQFLATNAGKRRISFDSISELAYYADDERAAEGLERMVALLEEYDAVGLFHVSPEVHDSAVLERFTAACDGVIEVDENGSQSTRF